MQPSWEVTLWPCISLEFGVCGVDRLGPLDLFSESAIRPESQDDE